MEKHPELADLGEDEQKVYAFLDKRGEYPAKEICNAIGFSFVQTLQALYNLQEKGLVISRGEFPKIYALRFKDPALNHESGYMYYI